LQSREGKGHRKQAKNKNFDKLNISIGIFAAAAAGLGMVN